MREFITRALGVTFMMAVLDAAYALWALATAGNSPLMSSAMASAIIVLSGGVTLAYVNDKRMLVPAAIGAFVGTYLTVVLAS